MARSGTSRISLLAHPHTSGEAARRIAARAECLSPLSLRLQYVLEGDLGPLRVPPPVPDAGRADKLWAHTCFEAFIGVDESPQYLELNFSPSGQWAAYRFESYRQGMVPAVLDAAPRLALRRGETQLELEVEISLSGILPAAEAAGERRLRIALSSVLEDEEGTLSYWALRHPPGRPDFHHPHGFALILEVPRKPVS